MMAYITGTSRILIEAIFVIVDAENRFNVFIEAEAGVKDDPKNITVEQFDNQIFAPSGSLFSWRNF